MFKDEYKDLKARLTLKESVIEAKIGAKIEAKFFAKDWINWGAPLSGFGSRIIKFSDKP